MRALQYKHTFTKGQAPFSKQLYQIHDLDFNKYLLVDTSGTILSRRYSEWELQPVDKQTVVEAKKLDELEQAKKQRGVQRKMQKEGLNTPTTPLTQPRQTRANTRTNTNTATAAQSMIAHGTRLSVMFRVERSLRPLLGTVQVVHQTRARDADGHVLYVDVLFDYGELKRNFKLFEDYYQRTDVESGWNLA